MRKKYRELPTQERLQELFHYNPETGIFTRRINRRRWKAGEIVGTITAGYHGGYISINVDYVIYRAHRLAWVYMTGNTPLLGVDHINGDRADNRWCNLREAGQTENSCNMRGKSNSATGLNGVYPNHNKFIAAVHFKGKKHYLGAYATKEEAKAARDAGAKLIHGEFFRS